MKTKIFIPLLTLILISCNNDIEHRLASGHFEAEERVISAELPGKIQLIKFQEGEFVKKGELIAIQDTATLFLSVEKVRATMSALRQKLSSADAQVAVLLEKQDYLKRELSRIEKLVESKAVPQKQKDDLEGELLVVKRQIEATKSTMSTANRSILSELQPLEAQIRILNQQISTAYIKSPISGMVVQIFTHDGEFAGPGKPVMKIADTDNMEFRMYLTGEQLAEMRIGQKVSVRPVGKDGGTLYEGELYWISTEAEFTPKNIQAADEKAQLVYAAKVRLKNDGTLKVGMPADYVQNNIGLE
ncbi:MAG: HlyD family efflux transporter periplasmic adaptor subunit [Cyclobacteriaceae bacterium]|nr:HlyD family efflux transporter periplasmic adaptor subunit [Cyclobacteriaceae bacterium]